MMPTGKINYLLGPLEVLLITTHIPSPKEIPQAVYIKGCQQIFIMVILLHRKKYDPNILGPQEIRQGIPQDKPKNVIVVRLLSCRFGAWLCGNP